MLQISNVKYCSDDMGGQDLTHYLLYQAKSLDCVGIMMVLVHKRLSWVDE